MQNKTVSIIGNRGFPHFFVGTSGVEVFTEEIISYFPKNMKLNMYVKSIYQNHFTKKNIENISIKIIPTVRSKVLESVLYSLLSSVCAAFDSSNIVWYHGIGQAMFAFIPKFFGKEIFITIHGADWKRKKWSFLEKIIFQLVVHFVFVVENINIFVVSHKLQQNLLKDFHVYSKCTFPGIKDSKLRQITGAKSSCKRDKINIKITGKYILFIGRLVPEKKVEVLIEAFKILQKKHKKIKLVIAGGHGNTKKYENYLIKKKNSSTYFTGYIFGDLKSYFLKNAAVLVLPSEIEGNPVSVMEALNKGTKVVMNEDCLEEDLKNIQGVYSFTDFESLVSKIEKSIFDEKPVFLSDKLLRKYSWKKSAYIYLKAMIFSKKGSNQSLKR